MSAKAKEAVRRPASSSHPGSFVNVPGCALRDPNLLGNDLRVYAVLLFLSGDSKRFDGGLDTIADWSHLSKRTANRSVRRLVKMGYISVKRRQRQTSLIVVSSPAEIYGDAVFDFAPKPLRVRRHKGASCPANSRRG